MKKFYAKNVSNFLKVLIVGFIFFNYMYQSNVAGHPLTADEGKSLLYIAVCGFLILCPIDASIFIKNLKSLNGGGEHHVNNRRLHEHDREEDKQY